MKNGKTVFTTNKRKAPNGIPGNNNQRDGPFVTKRVNNRSIHIPDSISEKDFSNLPEEVKKYIERIKKEEQLNHLVRQSNEILFKCHTVFPFDFWPDTLIVDKTKLNIIRKVFYFSESVHSIMIRTIKDLQVDTNIFFATLTIIPDVYMGQTTQVKYLRKSDALEARRIIQGLMLCERKSIDLSDLNADEIKHKIENAGTAVEARYAE